MAETHSSHRDRHDDSNRNSNTSLSVCDIPSFVKVDDNSNSNPKDRHDDSNRSSNVIICINATEKGDVDVAVRSLVSSMEDDTLLSFDEVHADYYRHGTLEIPESPSKSSLSLQESMIDLSNIESLTLSSDGHSDGQVDDTLDSPHQGGIQSTIDTLYNSKFKNSPSSLNSLKSSCRDGQIDIFDSLDQQETKGSINTNNDTKVDNFANTTSIPANTTLEITLDHSCFVNVGRHLDTDANAEPLSAQKEKNSCGDAFVAKHLFPNNAPTNAIESSSSMSTIWTAFFRLSWFGIISLVLAVYWEEREEDFVIDASVEEEPLFLNEEITSKLEYYMSRYGTQNTNISGHTTQNKEDLLNTQTEDDESGGGLFWFHYLRTVLPSFSYGIIFLCACLLLQITTLLKRGEICSSSKQPNTPSTGLSATKRCMKELSSLEDVNVFGSTYKHEIIRNDGSKAKVRRSARIVSTPDLKMSQIIAPDRCPEVCIKLMKDFESE